MKLVFLTALVTTSFGFCPLDSERDSSGEYCYSVYPYKWTHIQAMAHCKNFVQAGASIHNAFDNVALVDQALRKAQGQVHVWLGGYWNGRTVEWYDNSTAVYTNLADKDMDPGYLLLRTTDEKWVTLEGGEHAVACMGQDQDPPCDDEWLYSAKLKSCYKRIGNFSGITWQQARAECQAFGAELTSIHSDEENRIVVELADTYLDIQLNYANWTTAATWIGGYRTGPKATDFAWTDCSTFDYTHWAYTEPDNKDGQQPHVHVLTTRQNLYNNDDSKYLNKWDDIYDNVRGYNAICKKKPNA